VTNPEHTKPTLHERFRLIARKVSFWIGHPGAFLIAVLGVVIWALLQRLEVEFRKLREGEREPPATPGSGRA